MLDEHAGRDAANNRKRCSRKRLGVYRGSLRSLILCVAVAVGLSASPLVNSAAEFPVRAGILRTRLESDKAAYRVGETIRLRVTFINSTDHYLNYKWMPVWGLCGLIVHDGHGNLVVSKGNRGGFVSTAATAQFRPREARVADFYDPEAKLQVSTARKAALSSSHRPQANLAPCA
jgi:hypothetical protein